MVGEFDRLEERRKVYEQIGAKDKIFLNVACGSHFMQWEKQHPALHLASKEWLAHGRLMKLRRGELRVDPEGAIGAVAGS